MAVIKSIIAPSSDAGKLAEELGLAFNEEALKAKGLQGVLKDVMEATDGNIEQVSRLIPVSKGRAALALSSGEFERFDRALNNQSKATGKVDKAYQEMSNTIVASLKRVQTSFTSLVQGQLVEAGPMLVSVFDGLTAVLQALDSPMGRLISQLALATAGFWALHKAILAVKATALAAFITKQVALLTTFGAKIYIAAAATGAWNKAFLITKGLMATMPWAALAAALGYVAVKTWEAAAAKKSFEEALKSVDRQIVQAKIRELAEKLQEVEKAARNAAGGMSMFGGSMGTASLQAAQLKTQIAQLKGELAGLPQNYSVGGIEYDWKTGKAINPPVFEPPKTSLPDLHPLVLARVVGVVQLRPLMTLKH